MNEDIFKKLSKARSVMVLDHPFFARCALNLTFKEDETCQTAWTDGKYIGYNPDFVKSLTFKQTLGIIAHETLHPAFLHPFRRGDRDFGKWNMAADYAINGILLSNNFELPEGCLHNSKFDGMSAEAIYAQLPDNPGGQGQGTGPNGDVGNCGVCRDAPNPNDPNQKASQSQNAQMAQDWKITATQARQIAKAMGNCPGEIDRIIEELCQPKVDWKEQLYRFMDQIAKEDYRWTPPNRRYVYRDIYYPSMRSEELGTLIIGMDVSGSTDSKDIRVKFASELNYVLELFPAIKLNVVYVDTQVQDVQEFTSEDLPLNLVPQGGGGTDFRPLFEWITEQNIDPVCVVYFTDLQCDRFPESPRYPVLWAHIGHYGPGEKPPFGEVIELEG